MFQAPETRKTPGEGRRAAGEGGKTKGKGFWKEQFFALGLFFLPQIFLALIGWSDDSYLGPS